MKSSIKSSANLFITLIALSLISACSLLSGGSNVDVKSETMRIHFLSSNWKPLLPDTSDYAVQNPVTSSVITANSMCKKYDSTSLKHLTINIISGLEEPETLSTNTIKFSGREALKTTLKGKLDGVTTFMKIMTLRKNRCVYDFILISPSENAFYKDERSFEKFLSEVTIE